MNKKDKSKKRLHSDAKSLIERLAQAEEQFVSQPFLAPCIPGGQCRVKIGDVVCKIKIAPDEFQGFGIFQPLSFTEAILEREANLSERQRYLELFPSVRLIVTRRNEQGWLGTTANRGDSRFEIQGLVPIQLASEVRPFDIVITRFDGSVFWFERQDTRANPRHADFLRHALEDRIEPGELDFSGLSGEHRSAYEFNYWVLMHPREQRGPSPAMESEDSILLQTGDPNENRLRESLSHAGARLIGYSERRDSFQVTYQVNGQQHTSAVDKENLALISAGICLDGYDSNFDLTSLVGVLREGMQRGEF